jgi:hypothetical protein
MNCVPITACQTARTLYPICCLHTFVVAWTLADLGRTPTRTQTSVTVDSGDADRELDAAGRRQEDYVEADSRGMAGFGLDSHRRGDQHAMHRHPRPAATRRCSGLRIAWRRLRHHGLVTAMRTGIAGLTNALVGASVMLTAAIMCADPAGADPSQQQDQFLALLEQEQIPPTGVDEVPGVVLRAHHVCAELNSGTPIDALVDEEMDRGYAENPRLHLMAGRVRRTVVRFITASVDVYCPRHQGELPPYE